MRKLIALMVVLSGSALVSAQEGALTLEQALDRARNRAPLILSAQDRIEEARGRLRGASVLFQNNPQLDGAVGRRNSFGIMRTDAEVGFSQVLETGGQRSARMAGARAGIDRDTYAKQDVVRRLLADVARAHARALATQERLRLAQKANEVATSLQRGMDRRLEVGDVPLLDANLARAAAARARAEVRAGEAELGLALGDLKLFLGMASSEPIAVTGVVPWAQTFNQQALITSAQDRPEIRVAAAELRQAESEIRLGNGLAKPDVGVGGRYERDDGANVAKATVSFTLPIFNRGQELTAVGSAKATRLRREIDATKRAIQVEVETALNAYKQRADAATDLQQNALRLIDENELLAQRSFEEGEISLIELLLIRRDALEIRRLHADTLLEAALAAVEVQSRAGVLQ